jgi:hypothetical protein
MSARLKNNSMRIGIGFSIAIVLLSGAILSACQSKRCKHVPRSSFPIDEAEVSVDKSLLTGDPCAPPCWYHLTPGKSTEEDVLEILHDLPYANQDTIEVQSRAGFPGEKLIYWRSLASDKDDSRTGTVALDDEGQILFISYSPDYPLSLGKMIELFDVPDKVFVLYLGYDCYNVSLIWLNHGLCAGITIGESQQVLPDTLAENVGYFAPLSSPAEYLEINHLSQGYLNYFQEWEGFEAIKVPW